MTFKQYSDLRDYIISEYNYLAYKKSKAETYGLKWTAEDEANYQKWYASYKRINRWSIDIIKKEITKHNYEVFKQWAQGE